MKKNKEISRSKAIAVKTINEAFKILKEESGQLSGREVMDKIEERIEFDDWEKGTLEKTGHIRWQSILHFYTIFCIKAGYMRKAKGIWYLTPEGEAAFKKYNAVEFLDSAHDLYRKWKAERVQDIPGDDTEEDELDRADQIQQANLSQLEEPAIAGIKDFINNKSPYDFQDLVAALLRAMGYYTPFISPKGKDGGIDIIAYQDPLGISKPRIKVQVKHYPDNPVAADAIRSLRGLLHSTEDVGLFVTSGRFSPEAERFARESSIHLKLINGEELISLWQEFYLKMKDDDKNLLPLHSIYFLGSNE